MIDSGSIEYKECEERLTNLFLNSHHWLIKEAKKITKHKEESECLVSELYEYLHKKCNPKIFWGNSYNMFYCYSFLKSRWINKTKKLNRIVYKEDIVTEEVVEEYDIELDETLQIAHEEVMEELQKLSATRMWAPAKIFELYWMSDKTLDEVANDIKISKSTVFLSVKKIRKYMKEVIDNPFKDNNV
jgi:DNA-directed RNA polymerase specialized sigma24 family protein